jgi:hypothetical protein
MVKSFADFMKFGYEQYREQLKESNQLRPTQISRFIFWLRHSTCGNAISLREELSFAFQLRHAI